MKFEKDVKEHLSLKKLQLKQTLYSDLSKPMMDKLVEQGEYKHDGETLYCNNVLNSEVPDYKKYVYLPQYRDYIYSVLSNDFTLHPFSHHLNSSQSMIVNFLAPIKYHALTYNTSKFDIEKEFTKAVFGISGEITIGHAMNNACDERVFPETDFTITESNGTLNLFQVKYTEPYKAMTELNFEKYGEDELYGEPNEKFGLNLDGVTIQFDKIFDFYEDKPEDEVFEFTKEHQLIRNLYNTIFEIDEKKGLIKRTKPSKFAVINSHSNKAHVKHFERFRNRLTLESQEQYMLNTDTTTSPGYLSWEELVKQAVNFLNTNKEVIAEDYDELIEYYTQFNDFYLGF